jgi:RNA polymerase sigma-70 factor (ECF subfamily)
MAAAVDDFDALFACEYPAVVRTVFLICHDHQLAQDVTQDAFVELFARWEKVSRYDRPGAWVRRVAIRRVSRALQRERRRRVAERAVVPAETAEGADLDVLRAVRRLPLRQRIALVLHYYEDLPLHDVAAVLGCSPATAGVHVHRARAALASELSASPEGVSADGR